MAAVAPVMIVTILIILMLQLQSMSRMAMVFMTAPLGLIGVVIALLVTRAPLGFVAILGVIALSAMTMRNSVILIDQIRAEMEEGLDPWNAVVEAAVHRTRPVVLTATATVLAMVPLTRSVFWGPMAIAIMGGLIVATFLTIFFLPALYVAWFRVKRGDASTGRSCTCACSGACTLSRSFVRDGMSSMSFFRRTTIRAPSSARSVGILASKDALSGNEQPALKAVMAGAFGV